MAHENKVETPMNLGLVVADRCIFFLGGGVLLGNPKMMMFCMGKNAFVKISVISSQEVPEKDWNVIC